MTHREGARYTPGCGGRPGRLRPARFRVPVRQTPTVPRSWSDSTDAVRRTGSPAGAPGRGADSRTPALVIAALLVIGAGLGTINLFVDGVLRDGTPRVVYAATMALLAVIGVLLAVRRRAGRWTTFGLVLTGDVVYVVIAMSITDPLRYANPLMMLFAAFVAAWFLDRWMLAVHVALVPVACWIALAPSFPDTPALVVQVVVSAGMLDVAALGVFVLRRRVQRLLSDTQRLSSTDPLTGLANRRSLVSSADRLWRQALRDRQQVAALVLDLDHFKELNDHHGHATGDAVLQAVARGLAGVVRPSDVLARTGGEEMVVLGLAADAGEARQLGERLRAAVRAAAVDGTSVTASVGVALVHPLVSDDPQDAVWRLIDRADAAMYEAKQAGRDRTDLAPDRLPVPRTPTSPLSVDGVGMA